MTETAIETKPQAAFLQGSLLAVLASLLISCGADREGGDPAIDGLNDWLDTEYSNNQEKYGTDADILVARGLLADKKHRYVDLSATATGAGSDTLLEAFITTNGSGSSKAIAVTTVKPDAVQAALEFIGMTAGHPLDAASMHHWPKGERANITFYWDEAETGISNQSVRAEELVTDVRWDTRLPLLGFRFVGSSRPGAGEIVTAFNATNTVLEVPYVVDRKSIQGLLTASETYRFAAGQKLRIRMRPEFRDDRKRVLDFMLDVQPGTGAGAGQLQNLGVKLSTPEGEVLVDGNFETAFVYLKALIDDGREPFLQLRFADSLASGSVRTIAKFVQTFLITQDIRIDPNEAHLFYSAFLPREVWRDPQRRGRASQPVEIHLGGSVAEGLSGEIIQYPGASDTTATVTRSGFDNEEELTELIQEGQPWETDGVFLFVRPDSPYGKVRKVHELVRTLFPNVYVFM